MKKGMLRPKHPERLCWGCELLCPADALRCGNGTERTQHPIELFGPEWIDDESDVQVDGTTHVQAAHD